MEINHNSTALDATLALEEERRLSKVHAANPSLATGPGTKPLHLEGHSWYVAQGCQPIRVSEEMAAILSADRMFDRERDALQFALIEKQAAREMWEREYNTLLNRIDKLDAQDTEF